MAENAGLSFPSRHRWVGEILTRGGATLTAAEDGVYTFTVADSLAEFLDRDRIEITFRKRLAAKNGVELASPGSWLHDQLLRFARLRGKVTAGYLPAREDLDRDKAVGARRRGFLRRETLREARYGTILVFTFRVSYYSEPAREEIQHVAFDCERGRVDKRPVYKQLLRFSVETPEKGIKSAPKNDFETAFKAAWEVVQDEVESTVHRIQLEGREAADERIATVERYYRQLLSEEKRLLKTRATRRGEQETRNKIDLLKLEWERRVKEETERLKPQVVATLSAIAKVWVPLELWDCVIEKEGEEALKGVWLDLARGEAWEASRASKAGKR